MQERQVSIDGDDARARAAVPRPRDAEPDRVRGHLPAARGAARPVRAAHGLRLPGSPTTSGSSSSGGSTRQVDEVELRQVVDRPILLEMQRAVEEVHVDESVGRYVVELVTATRESRSVSVGSSPRGSLALLKLSRCRAALAGRDFVTPDDVKGVAVPALAHRLVLRPELWVQRRTGEDVVRELLDEVPTPATESTGTAAGVTRSADARLGAYAALAAVGLVAALALRRAELAVGGGPVRAPRGARRACEPRRRSAPGSTSTGNARSRATSSRGRSPSARRPASTASSSASSCRASSRSRRERTRSRSDSRRARSASCRFASVAGAGRRSTSATSGCAREIASGSSASRDGSTAAGRSRSTRRRSGSASVLSPRTRRPRRGARSPVCAPRASSSPTPARS